jgi:hypothetical protein
LFSHVPSHSDRAEVSFVVVLTVTSAATLAVLSVTVVAACLWRQKRKLVFLGQKSGDLLRGCCGQDREGREADSQPASVTTSEGKLGLRGIPALVAGLCVLVSTSKLPAAKMLKKIFKCHIHLTPS